MVTPAKKRYVQELTREEAWELLEDQSRRRLGVGLQEFIAKWFAGDYGDDPDDSPDALELAVLLPGVGIDPWRNDQRSSTPLTNGWSAGTASRPTTPMP